VAVWQTEHGYMNILVLINKV